jgi:hypothetical protein
MLGKEAIDTSQECRKTYTEIEKNIEKYMFFPPSICHNPRVRTPGYWL